VILVLLIDAISKCSFLCFVDTQVYFLQSIVYFNPIAYLSKPHFHPQHLQVVVDQVCRLARTIASPHENAHCVLVAEGSPGQSTVITKLAAHLCGYTVYQISPSPLGSSPEYKMDQFKADLVQGYTRAGAKVRKLFTLLFFTL